MNQTGIKAAGASTEAMGLNGVANAYWNLSPAQLVEHAVSNGEAKLADNGALAADTGKFTGRSPKDKFVVADDTTEDSVWWGDVNNRFEEAHFEALHQKMLAHFAGKDIFIKDAFACADPQYRISIRVVTELAYSNLFAHNLFLRPTHSELLTLDTTDWTILNAPSFEADAAIDGTRQGNFAIISFKKRTILIGGTGYTGEIKKSIFSVLNYVLPHTHGVLSMHCSANKGNAGDTAIFFGLSGTGKTTLSADPNRGLIGDDEHGWSDNGIFNFEGGCYAKCIGLTHEKEPEIWDAIKFGALVENTRFHDGTRTVDYDDVSVTENTRVAYPIDHIANAVEPSVGSVPKNIFFLTADAFGVLPPISKLSSGQAQFHFISGYTAKVAGTEMGVTEPQTTFSACFGKAFLPLHPTRYASLLADRMKKHNVNVWLVNTGWTGGAFGDGERMKLRYTRAMITAALEGQLDSVRYETHPVFGMQVPQECPNVPTELLNPRTTWKDANAYDAKAQVLAREFVKNFAQYRDGADAETLDALPKVAENEMAA